MLTIRLKQFAILAAIAAVISLTLLPRVSLGLANQPLPVLTPPLTLDPGDPIGPDFPELPCQPWTGAKGITYFDGIPLIGLTMRLTADHIKLSNQDPYCAESTQALSPGDWSWELRSKPDDSSTTLEGTDTLEPTIFIDAAGDYEVVLTICPDSCAFGTLTVLPVEKTTLLKTTEFLRPERFPVSPMSVRNGASCDLETGTCEESSIPCDSDLQCQSFVQPLLEPDLVDIKCQFGGGVTDPQWVTVKAFNGVEDYSGFYNGVVHALEGVVTQARISSMDSSFNHHSQDANWNVRPDAIYRHMKTSSGSSMHNEWETRELDRAFQPSAGDRISMWGHLIHDCGHGGFKTEIHPPVGLAVHRERTVSIPDDWTSEDLPNPDGSPGGPGLGVYMPGVVTDVRFNRDAGQMIEGGDTHLAQPARFEPVACALDNFVSTPFGTFRCTTFRGNTGVIVPGDSITGLSPINGIFRFRVHLPRSPQAVLEAAGVNNIPPTPLYHDVFPGNIAGSRINVDVITEPTGTSEPDVTFLQVTVDLTGSIGTNTPWFRMAAAWVYPDPENWGLEKRRVTIDKLNVTNEGDGLFRGEGDWTLWAQVNNSSLESPILTTGLPLQEWSRIIRGSVEDGCDFYFGIGCGQDYTFGGQPWSTNNSNANRSLGPDLLVFPGQPVRLHMSGFEGDWLGGDSLGTINEFQYGEFDALGNPNDEPVKNACQNPDIDFIAGDDLEGHLPINAGCARFSVFYKVQNLGPVDPPLLSVAANNLRDRYRLRATDCNDDVGPCVDQPFISGDAVVTPAPPGFLHPLEEVVLPGDELPSLFASELYEKRENEEYVLNSLNVPDLNAKIEADLANEPEVAAAFLAELRASLQAALEEFGNEALLDLQLVRLAIPNEQFQQYFGDFPAYEPIGGTTTRYIRGAGQVGNGREATNFRLNLKCDPTQASSLRIAWKDDPYNHRRFDLDLVLEAACQAPDEPMKSYAGRGFGRVNDVDGYLAEWTLIDNGKGRNNADRVGFRIVAPDGQVVHEIIGDLSGQIHALED